MIIIWLLIAVYIVTVFYGVYIAYLDIKERDILYVSELINVFLVTFMPLVNTVYAAFYIMDKYKNTVIWRRKK